MILKNHFETVPFCFTAVPLSAVSESWQNGLAAAVCPWQSISPENAGWIPEGKLEGKRAACPFWQLSIGLGGYLSAALSRYSFEGCVCNTD